jgi:hypothetical protein
MGSFRFDWRWVILIGFVAILANGRALPWPITALVLGGSGGYLLNLAWRSWGGSWGGLGGSRRVTYWRGRRIEMGGPPRRVRRLNLSEMGPVLIYALIGLALVLAGIVVALRGLGI